MLHILKTTDEIEREYIETLQRIKRATEYLDALETYEKSGFVSKDIEMQYCMKKTREGIERLIKDKLILVEMLHEKGSSEELRVGCSNAVSVPWPGK